MSFNLPLELDSSTEFSWPIIDDARYITIDTETTGLNPHAGDYMFACSIATKYGSWYLPFRSKSRYNMDESAVLSFVKDLAKDTRRIFLFYNAPFDLSFFRREGIEFSNNIIDVMVVGHIHNNNRTQVGLKELARELGFETLEETALKEYKRANKIMDYSYFPNELIAPYAKADAELTFNVFKKLYTGLDEQSKAIVNVEAIVTKALFEMEDYGMRVDLDYLYTLKETYLAKIRSLEDELLKYSIIPTENATIAKYIEQNKLTIHKTTSTGRVSTDEEALRLINHPVLNMVLDYREVRKLFSTYVVGLLERNIDGIVRFDYRQTGTVTGRFSGNSQQFPRDNKDIRRAFIPRDGNVFIISDYAGQEARLWASYSGDERLIASYKADDKFDIHNYIGQKLNIPRQQAKTLVFASLYGAGRERIAHQLGVDIDTAVNILNVLYEQFPSIKKLSRELDRQIRTNGFIRNKYGRKLYVNADDSYKGVNYLIQSSGADMMKRAFARAYLDKPDYINIVSSIHDELIFECPKDKIAETVEFVSEIMTDRLTFDVPMLVDISISETNWADKRRFQPQEA